MNNNIFEITNNFDFNKIKLGNPNILNHGNHFSKIFNGDTNKNIYIQLPQCYSKQGIVTSGQRKYCEPIFNTSDNYIANFFENLQEYLANQIFISRDDWFYEGSDMTIDDISELMNNSIRSYKSGKCFTLKCYIKNNKFLIYDEDQNIVNVEDYNIENPIIPLININGIKFSSKAITIEYILTQFMIIKSTDEFESQILINNNNLGTKYDKPIDHQNKIDISNNQPNNDNESDKLTNDNKLEHDNQFILSESYNNSNELANNISNEENIDELANNISNEENIDELANNISNEENINELANNISNEENIDDYDNNLHEISNLDISSDDTIKIKDKNEIYIELYYSAKKKAKEIRNNAIEAFLHAKSIKNKYNLQELIESDSDSDSDIDSNNNEL